ncbi:hypothetical protein PENDEC_c031G05438 [Penicillium decumbens]|uniref:GS catalytic domain-containing protein n=1 Tax=Penicillium decumbens TaxID=69771 RepID=A0A1V6NVM6_PENDC|nr:hypothetical protein PENDEC_c031G05438 [Penicillium decumbens]
MLQALEIAEGKRVLSIGPVAFQFTLGNAFLPDIDARGKDVLIPDWTSLYTRPGLDLKYATVMCEIVEYTPTQAEPNWNFCPRHTLNKMVQKVQSQLQVDLLIGFEVEFIIMKRGEGGEVIPHSRSMGGFSVAGYRDPLFAHVEEAIEVLEGACIRFDTVQSEGIQGQYEISLLPLPPMQAIDQLLVVHDTLKAVFMSHGLIATMAPRPIPGLSSSNGQHAHISLNPPNKEEQFLAGILKRLPQLLALCLPYELSYERVTEYCAGTAVAWGTENRAVPIRKIKAGHWELRFIDASANMYLALAALLGAGLSGCINEETLAWQDTAFDESQSPSDGVMLPKEIDDAINQLEGAVEDLDAVLGTRVIKHFVHMKKFEIAMLREKYETPKLRGLMSEIF